jgi:hypothetical protein
MTRGIRWLQTLLRRDPVIDSLGEPRSREKTRHGASVCVDVLADVAREVAVSRPTTYKTYKTYLAPATCIQKS